MNDIDLTSPELYINRELSLLEFNRRVLEQAKDENVPLLERVRFLCISSTNLDEFFEIRVAGLKSLAEAGSLRCGPDGLSPLETLKIIRQNVSQMIAEQYRILNEVLIPQLGEHGIRALRRIHWSEAQDSWLRKLFNNELLPILSPLGLDPAHPFPRILNKSSAARMPSAATAVSRSSRCPAPCSGLSGCRRRRRAAALRILSFCPRSFTPMWINYFTA